MGAQYKEDKNLEGIFYCLSKQGFSVLPACPGIYVVDQDGPELTEIHPYMPANCKD